MSRESLFLIKTLHKGYGLFSRNPIKQHEAILVYEGQIMPMEIADAKRAIQLNHYFALELLTKGCLENYVNHSCQPNCWLDLKTTGVPILRALRDINADEELCYNYNTVEYNLLDAFTMFHCRCEAPSCVGLVQGYLHLTPQQQIEVQETVAPYIKEKHAESRD